MSSYPHKTVLVVGATSGIGLALAEKLIANSSHVIAVGRRRERLDALVQKHGGEKVSAMEFDITDLEGIPAFVKSITDSHPTLSSAILNSGIQRTIDFANPAAVDLAAVSTEFTTNYLSHVHLVTALLPFFQAQSQAQAQAQARGPEGSHGSNSADPSLVFTTSGLALVPIPKVANYCASKAAMHHLILCLREQLKGGDGEGAAGVGAGRVKVVEILPPAVKTELHDRDGGPVGMDLDEFTEEAWRGLVEGKEDIPVGMSKMSYNSWEMKRQEIFHMMVERMKAGP